MPTPDEQYILAQTQVRQSAPPGWAIRWVDPPWVGQPPECRGGCGVAPMTSALVTPGKRWSVATLTKLDKSARTVWWSLAQVCEPCFQNQKIRDKIAIAIFAPLAPEVVS